MNPEKAIVKKFHMTPRARLLSHTHQVGGNPVEYLAQNKYNEISHLEIKKVGGTLLQHNADYRLSIQYPGWMTRINNPANLNGKLTRVYEIKIQSCVFYSFYREIQWKYCRNKVEKFFTGYSEKVQLYLR
ncbi:hypothetical protein [Chryseobacterium sp. Marseille-Q8038]